ncbi:MAG TPA: CsiV family protein [Steroidobacteraceae bacterium]
MRKRILQNLSLPLVAIVAVTLQASGAEPTRLQESAYNIELVIFRALTPLGVQEDWSVESGRSLPGVGVAVDDGGGGAADATTSRLSVSSLSPALFRLSGIESSLQRSRSYEVIGHIGWTQIAVPRGSGLAVDLSEIGLSGLSVQGTGALERGKYLYLRLDLAYAPGQLPASLVGDVQSAGPVTFSLSQVRRVRPFERHYFDHPAFGVIALISPVS